MFRAETRVRGMFHRVKKMVESSVKNGLTDALFALLADGLTKAGYHGYYFSKTGTSPYCDKKGAFRCQSAWNVKRCPRRSVIFPLRNYRQRIELTNWQFEHTITIKDISAFIIKWAEKMPEGKHFSWPHFYQMLFHPSYVMFVERGCHEGGQKGRIGLNYDLAIIDDDFEVEFNVREHARA